MEAHNRPASPGFDNGDLTAGALYSVAISLKRIADQGDQRNAAQEESGPRPKKPAGPTLRSKTSTYPSPQRLDHEQTMQNIGLNADEIREMKK